MNLVLRLAHVAAVVSCFAQQDARAPEFLRPADESILNSGALQVVARVKGPSKLLVDGKVAPSTYPAPTALLADVQLSPGEHELALEDGPKIRVFVAGGSQQPPAGWQTFRPHPPAAKCESCHLPANSAWSLESLPTVDSCKGCHDLAKFPETHTHAPGVLEECQLCHRPHGSKATFHLKFEKETACKQCHG